MPIQDERSMNRDTPRMFSIVSEPRKIPERMRKTHSLRLVYIASEISNLIDNRQLLRCCT